MSGRRRVGRLVSITPVRELHSRTNDGIRVQLLWSEGEDRVFVSAYDSKTTLSVDVPDRSRALDVFLHPFAYAT